MFRYHFIYRDRLKTVFVVVQWLHYVRTVYYIYIHVSLFIFLVESTYIDDFPIVSPYIPTWFPIYTPHQSHQDPATHQDSLHVA